MVLHACRRACLQMPSENPDMSPELIKSPRHSLDCMRSERRTERCVESLRDEADLRDQMHRTRRAAEDQLWTLEDQERKVHCCLKYVRLCVSRLQRRECLDDDS